MSLMHKPIDQISESDLIQLINIPVYESRILDYKEQLPGDSSSEKKEFLYDITSFANAGGGELIFGIKEERLDGKTTGRPESISGVFIDNKDGLIRKYENIIRTSVQPRIFGLQMEVISLANGNSVLIIRIPNSLNSPHMVTLEGSQRFFTRNSAGKHPMDITEIRSTILASTELASRIESFRIDRLSRVKCNQTSIVLEDIQHFLVVHIIPFNAFGNDQYPATVLKGQLKQLVPLYASGWSYKYNLNGFTTFSKWPNRKYAHSYVQIFRNGIIESVDNGMLRPDTVGKVIYSGSIEQEIVKASIKHLQALEAIEVSPPVVMSISLMGVKDFRFVVPMGFITPDGAGVIDQDDIFLPELIMERYPEDTADFARMLQGTFDSLWNAAGWPRSLNYDSEGNWAGLL